MRDFDYPEWDDDEDLDLCQMMQKAAEAASWHKVRGIPDPKECEVPSPTAKSPRKRANFFSDLVDGIAKNGQILMAEDDQAFAYEEELGCYRPIPKLTVWLANFFPEFTTRSLLANDIREIAQRLTWRSDIRCDRDSFNRSRELVNVENGVFNLETGELLPHDPRFRFTYQIRASYLTEPEVPSCPAFDAFCASSLEGDLDKRRLLSEIIGYICSDQSAGKCAFFLKGEPNSGKSVVSEFIARLFDPSVISSIPLHQLGDRFFRAELAGKKVNIAGEIAGRSLRDISIFKSITGGDRIAGEYKGRDPFYFTPRCKLLFSGNTLPRTTEADTTAAFVNRLVVLLFNRSIPRQQQDKQLPNKLWQERDAIVTFALRSMQEVMGRNFLFTLPADSNAFLRSFADRANTLQGFLEEVCVLVPGAKVFNVDLYRAFSDYCDRNGLDCFSRTRFYDLLSGVPGVIAKRVRIGSENRQGHIGICLKTMFLTGTPEQTAQPLAPQAEDRSKKTEKYIIDEEDDADGRA